MSTIVKKVTNGHDEYNCEESDKRSTMSTIVKKVTIRRTLYSGAAISVVHLRHCVCAGERTSRLPFTICVAMARNQLPTGLQAVIHPLT